MPREMTSNRAQMSASGGRWSVVATVREPAALLLAFAAHHLDLGALHVHLYLDGPHPDLEAAIGADPRVTLITCDDAFYSSIGRRRPGWINRRQIVNANHAETLSDADWLFHLDADEFLTADPAEELAALPPEIAAYWVQNGERVYLEGAPLETIFDGALALPMTDPGRLARVRGPDMGHLTRHGLLAHALGKGALRVGGGIGAGIHRPRCDTDVTHAADTVRISHFDGLTRLHWALKLQRHAENGVLPKPGRRHSSYRDQQIALAVESGGDLAPIVALHDRLRVIPPLMARRMSRIHRLKPTGVDASASLTRIFPGVSADLSVEAFDAALQVERAGREGHAALLKA